MLHFHKERGAGATLAAIEVPSEDAQRFGVLQVDAESRLTGFLEKPKDLPPGEQVLASLGIYIFDVSVLVPALEEDARRSSAHDFGKDIIPELIAKVPVFAYRFEDENKKGAKDRRDIGTLDADDDANMDRCHVNPDFNLDDPEWPLRTNQVQAPPAKFVFADEGRRCGQALDSVISAGCIISGSRVAGSALRPNVRCTASATSIRASSCRACASAATRGFRRAIIDRDALVPRGALIGYNAEEDRQRHTVSESGIVAVTTDDEPFIGEIGAEVLRNEAEFDRRGTETLRTLQLRKKPTPNSQRAGGESRSKFHPVDRGARLGGWELEVGT